MSPQKPIISINHIGPRDVMIGQPEPTDPVLAMNFGAGWEVRIRRDGTVEFDGIEPEDAARRFYEALAWCFKGAPP